MLSVALVAVPIFNIDKRPFALLCAYNVSDQTRRYVRVFFPNYHINTSVTIYSIVGRT